MQNLHQFCRIHIPIREKKRLLWRYDHHSQCVSILRKIEQSQNLQILKKIHTKRRNFVSSNTVIPMNCLNKTKPICRIIYYQIANAVTQYIQNIVIIYIDIYCTRFFCSGRFKTSEFLVQILLVLCLCSFFRLLSLSLHFAYFKCACVFVYSFLFYMFTKILYFLNDLGLHLKLWVFFVNLFLSM